MFRTSQSQHELHQPAPQQNDAASEKKGRSRRRGRAPSIARMCMSRTRRSMSVDSAEFDLNAPEEPPAPRCRARSISQDRLESQAVGTMPSGSLLSEGTAVDLLTELHEKRKALEHMSVELLASEPQRSMEESHLRTAPMVFGLARQELIESQQQGGVTVETSVVSAHQENKLSSVILQVPSVPSAPAICQPSRSQLKLEVESFGSDPDDSYGLNPPLGGRRSNSFDHATPWPSASSPDDPLSTDQMDLGGASSLTVPKPAGLFRRASWEIPKICLHCMHLETLAAEEKNRGHSSPDSENLKSVEDDLSPETLCSSEASTSDSSISDCDGESDNDKGSPVFDPVVRFTLEGPEDDDPATSSAQQRRSSTCAVPSSNPPHADTVPFLSKDTSDTQDTEKRKSATSRERSHKSPPSPSEQYKDVVSLTVPVVKQRSTSMDAACLLSPPSEGSPGRQARSRSVDANVSRKASNTLAILALVHQSFK